MKLLDLLEFKVSRLELMFTLHSTKRIYLQIIRKGRVKGLKGEKGDIGKYETEETLRFFFN